MSDLKAPDVTLAQIDALIRKLPRYYRALAKLVRTTGVEPKIAIGLEASRIQELLATQGSRAIIAFCRVPPRSDREYLLPMQMRRRAWLLQRLNVAKDQEPPAFYLDEKANPITLEIANAVLAEVSSRMTLARPISLETIASAVLSSFLEKVSAIESHDYVLSNWELYRNHLLVEPTKVYATRSRHRPIQAEK